MKNFNAKKLELIAQVDMTTVGSTTLAYDFCLLQAKRNGEPKYSLEEVVVLVRPVAERLGQDPTTVTVKRIKRHIDAREGQGFIYANHRIPNVIADEGYALRKDGVPKAKWNRYHPPEERKSVKASIMTARKLIKKVPKKATAK